METTIENINSMLSIVKYVFDNYSDYEPVLTGSLAMYLQGIDYGEINDVDIIFFKRIKSKSERDRIFNDINQHTDIVMNLFNGKQLYEYSFTDYEIDGTTIKMQEHSSIYKYLKETFDENDPKAEQRLHLFEIYEEFLNKLL